MELLMTAIATAARGTRRVPKRRTELLAREARPTDQVATLPTRSPTKRSQQFRGASLQELEEVPKGGYPVRRPRSLYAWTHSSSRTAYGTCSRSNARRPR